MFQYLDEMIARQRRNLGVAEAVPGVAALPVGANPGNVFRMDAAQLHRLFEETWNYSDHARLPNGGTNAGAVTQLASPIALYPSGVDFANPLPPGFANGNSLPIQPPGIAEPRPVWRNLIYAFLIESTGAYEIMAEVVRRLKVGETLSTLTPASTQWLRATDTLFYSENSALAIRRGYSNLTPREASRNAYWRLFGLDLPHVIPLRWSKSVGSPWKDDVGPSANVSFREKWSELLRQLWLGIENSNNFVGANATDGSYVALLCQTISDMLLMRRQGGQLLREEYEHVSAMDWFDLTLSQNYPIVVDLGCDATNAADRLAKLGQLVGMTPAPRAREMFELARFLPTLLRQIELRNFNTRAQAETLYRFPSLLRDDVNQTIDLWQSATGDRVKDRAVAVTAGGSAQPVRLPAVSPAQFGR
jgi:hypothetical protein